MQVNGAVELTSFFLVKNKTFDDFMEATQDIHVWLGKRKGFRGRHAFQDDAGRIYDMVFWDTKTQGVKTMEKLMQVFADSPVHRLINHRTVNWCVQPVYS